MKKESTFFEEKKQKTVALTPASPDGYLLEPAQRQTSKSFLAAFFQKRTLLLSCLRFDGGSELGHLMAQYGERRLGLAAAA
jgi:hypothetical protein